MNKRLFLNMGQNKCNSNASNSRPLLRWERLFNRVQNACVSIETVNQDRSLNGFGSGFILKKCGCYYIMTTFSVVLYNLVVQNNQINYMIWPEIYALISGINDTEQSRYYRLRLLAVDGAADLALLEIEKNLYNTDLPKLCNHDAIQFSTGEIRAGQLVAAIGYVNAVDHQSISTGMIREPHHLLSVLSDPVSYLLHDIVVGAGSQGSPILDAQGRLVGIHSFSYNIGDLTDEDVANNTLVYNFPNVGVGGGPSINEIKRFFNAYFNQPERFSNVHAGISGNLLMSSLGSYKRYLKGYLGVTLDVFGSGSDIIRYLPIGQNWPNRNVNGAVILGVDPSGGIALSGLTGPALSNPPHEIGNDTNPNMYIRPRLRLPIRLSDNILDGLNVLLSIDGNPIGDILNNEISIADILWDKLPSETVEIEYQSLEKYFENSVIKNKLIVKLQEWPTNFDISIPLIN